SAMIQTCFDCGTCAPAMLLSSSSPNAVSFISPPEFLSLFTPMRSGRNRVFQSWEVEGALGANLQAEVESSNPTNTLNACVNQITEVHVHPRWKTKLLV